MPHVAFHQSLVLLHEVEQVGVGFGFVFACSCQSDLRNCQCPETNDGEYCEQGDKALSLKELFVHFILKAFVVELLLNSIDSLFLPQDHQIIQSLFVHFAVLKG